MMIFLVEGCCSNLMVLPVDGPKLSVIQLKAMATHQMEAIAHKSRLSASPTEIKPIMERAARPAKVLGLLTWLQLIRPDPAGRVDSNF